MILLVIDTQKGITDERLYEFHKFRENVGCLIKTARENGVEVVFVRHDDGEGSGFSKGDDAFEIYEGFAPLEGEKIFDKKYNSCFHPSTGLLRYLKAKGIEKIIAVGIATDYCMDASIKSGFENGFEMIVPAFCNSTRDNEFMDAKTTYEFYNNSMWPERYAKCITVEEAEDLIRNCEKNDVPERRLLNECGSMDVESERLLLRKFTYDDIDSMMRNWVSDDEVQHKYGEPSYKTKEEVRALLDTYIAGYNSGLYFRWAIIEKTSGECIGQIAFFLVDPNNHFAEIEYCIGRGFQKKGYATEATKAVTKFGLETVGLHKVQICVRPVNTPSRRVIEKSGFTYNGTLKDYFYMDGGYQSRMYFSILEDEDRTGIESIHHISMKTGDPERFEKTKAFYRDILGLDIFSEWDEGVFFGIGNSYLEIWNNGDGSEEKGAIRHFALSVRGVDAMAEKIRKSGYEVFVGPKDIQVATFRARICFLKGPLGEEIELFEEI